MPPTAETPGAAAGGPRARARRALWLVHVLVALLYVAPALLRGETFYAFDTLTRSHPWRDVLGEREVENPLITDPVTDSYPRQVYLREHARESGLPLWNDSIVGGAPDLVTANPLVLALQLALPTDVAHDLVILLCLAAAGVGMHLFLRATGLSDSAALVGGLAWALNGWVGVWLEYEPVPLVAAALPCCLLLGERWLARPSLATFLGWTAAFAWATSAAYTMAFQLLEYALLVAGALYLVRVLRGRGRLSRAADLAAFAGALAAGCLLSAWTLATVWDTTRELSREPLAFAAIYERIGRLSPWYLATTVFPDFFGSPTLAARFQPRAPSQTYNNYSELCVYVGLPVLVLALAALSAPRRRDVLFFASTALLAVLMAAGSVLYWPLFRLAPGLSFASPTRTLFVFGFACCVLAAHGLEELSRPGRRARLFVPLLVVAGVAAGFLAVARAPGAARRFLALAHLPAGEERLAGAQAFFAEHFALGSPVVLAPLVLLALTALVLLAWTGGPRRRPAVLAALAALVAWDLGGKGLSYNTTSPRSLAYPPTPAIERLQRADGLFRVAVRVEDGFALNSLVPFGLQMAGGYASAQSARYVELLGADRRGGRWVALENLESAVTDLLNVEYVLTARETELASAKWELVHDEEVRVYRNRRVFPRAFFVPQARVLDGPQATLAAVRSARPRDLRATVFLEEEPPFAGDADAVGTVTVATYEPDRIVLVVDTDGPGFCVVGDTWHPGWRARVDGAPAPVLCADHVLRAVPVPAGARRVELDFEPPLVLAGLRTSALAWLAWAALAAAGLARRRRGGA